MSESSEPPGRLLRTLVVVEVLHRDPIEFATLADLHHLIDDGDASGNYTVEQAQELSPAQMHDALIKQGSDPQFLLTEEEMESMGEGGGAA